MVESKQVCSGLVMGREGDGRQPKAAPVPRVLAVGSGLPYDGLSVALTAAQNPHKLMYKI